MAYPYPGQEKRKGDDNGSDASGGWGTGTRWGRIFPLAVSLGFGMEPIKGPNLLRFGVLLLGRPAVFLFGGLESPRAFVEGG